MSFKINRRKNTKTHLLSFNLEGVWLFDLYFFSSFYSAIRSEVVKQKLSVHKRPGEETLWVDFAHASHINAFATGATVQI